MENLYCRKECELPFTIESRPLNFRVFLLAKADGEVYVYDKIDYFTEESKTVSEAITDAKKQDDVFTAYNDSFRYSEREIYDSISMRYRCTQDFMLSLNKRLTETTVELFDLIG